MDKSNYSEQTAIERAIVGKDDAFRYLLEKYKSYAFTIAVGIVKNEEDAEEITQDSFVKAFNNIAKFKKSGKFSTWLYRIVYNTSLTSLRGVKMNLEPLEERQNHELELSDNYKNGFERLIRDDQVRYINKAVLSLSKEEKLAVTLYYNNECSIVEIGEITGWNLSTIKTRLYRARQNLYIELSRLLRNEIKDMI